MDVNQHDQLLNEMKVDFCTTKTIKALYFFTANLLCKRKYKRLIAKSQSVLNKELDLRKFIYR